MPRQTAAYVKKEKSKVLKKVREEKRREKKELLEQIDTLIGAINDATVALNEALAVSKHYSKKYH